MYKTVYQRIAEAMNEYSKFAFDGCHKIYIIENEDQTKEAIESGYQIYDIEELSDIYSNSCNLKFIRFWDLDKGSLVSQGEY